MACAPCAAAGSVAAAPRHPPQQQPRRHRQRQRRQQRRATACAAAQPPRVTLYDAYDRLVPYEQVQFEWDEPRMLWRRHGSRLQPLARLPGPRLPPRAQSACALPPDPALACRPGSCRRNWLRRSAPPPPPAAAAAAAAAAPPAAAATHPASAAPRRRWAPCCCCSTRRCTRLGRARQRATCGSTRPRRRTRSTALSAAGRWVLGGCRVEWGRGGEGAPQQHRRTGRRRGTRSGHATFHTHAPCWAPTLPAFSTPLWRR